MNITYVYADSENEWNNSEWRCAVPARTLNKTGHHKAYLVSIKDFARNASAAKSACKKSDVIVVQRSYFSDPVPSRIRQWQASGKAVIGDFDDAFNYMPKSNAGYKYWIQERLLQQDAKGKKRWSNVMPHPLVQFRESLSGLDAVTVSSELLVKDWEKYNKSINYLPYYINLDRYAGAIPTRHNEIVIGWGGSATHLESFSNSKNFLPCRRYVRNIPICA